MPTLDRNKFASSKNLEKGAYILLDCEGTPEIILIGTGSELHLVIEAQELLIKEGIKVRVVTMPSWELFEKQSKAYKENVFHPSVRTRLSVEAGVTFGWYKYVTAEGDVIGIDRFGESGPGNEVMSHLGFTTENVYQPARALLKKHE